MKSRSKSKGKLVFISTVILAFVCVTFIPAAYSGQLSAAKQLLNASGIKAKIVNLNRADGFSKAVVVKGPNEVPVMVAFSDDCVAGEMSFLVSVNGNDEVVSLFDDGEYEVENLQGADFDSTVCIVNAIFNMLMDLQTCGNDNLCVSYTVFNFIVDIVSCSNTEV